jgi:CRP/FNR family cyclic AMP-dependent transcriptional regulator
VPPEAHAPPGWSPAGARPGVSSAGAAGTPYHACMPRPPTVVTDWFSHPALGDSLRALARRGEVRRYARGSLLIQEGDVGDTLYVILGGRLRAFSVSLVNGREITYGSYGPGEYVGELGLDGGPRTASVIALEPSVCSVVTRATLEAHIAEQPGFAVELLAKVIRSARSATLAARQLALTDVYGRLKGLLESLAGPAQADGRRAIAERLTHQEMAHRVGCTREMVSRVMRDLARGGYVADEKSRLTLLRPLPARW